MMIALLDHNDSVSSATAALCAERLAVAAAAAAALQAMASP
jgi:hypothetical protein